MKCFYWLHLVLFFPSFIFWDPIAFADIAILAQIVQGSTLQDGKHPPCSGFITHQGKGGAKKYHYIPKQVPVFHYIYSTIALINLNAQYDSRIKVTWAQRRNLANYTGAIKNNQTVSHDKAICTSEHHASVWQWCRHRCLQNACNGCWELLGTEHCQAEPWAVHEHRANTGHPAPSTLLITVLCFYPVTWLG